MSLKDDTINPDFETERISWPTHLNCPYCPAQSYPIVDNLTVGNKLARRFVCPAGHAFFVTPERKND